MNSLDYWMRPAIDAHRDGCLNNHDEKQCMAVVYAKLLAERDAEVERLRSQIGPGECLTCEVPLRRVEAERDALAASVEAVRRLCDEADEYQRRFPNFDGSVMPGLVVTPTLRAVLPPQPPRDGTQPPPTIGLRCRECGIEVVGSTLDDLRDWKCVGTDGWYCPVHGPQEATGQVPDEACGDWPAPCNCDDPRTHSGHNNGGQEATG